MRGESGLANGEQPRKDLAGNNADSRTGAAENTDLHKVHENSRMHCVE